MMKLPMEGSNNLMLAIVLPGIITIIIEIGMSFMREIIMNSFDNKDNAGNNDINNNNNKEGKEGFISNKINDNNINSPNSNQ